jgi:hypothetical protein
MTNLNRLDIIEPGDRAALICIDQEDLADLVIRHLDQMGYRIHTAMTGEDLTGKLHGHAYDVVVTWQYLGGRNPDDNQVLIEASDIPMNVRRRQFFVLIGPDMDTANDVLAFRFSVDLVVHMNDARNFQTALRNGITRHAQRYSRFDDVVNSANLD